MRGTEEDTGGFSKTTGKSDVGCIKVGASSCWVKKMQIGVRRGEGRLGENS